MTSGVAHLARASLAQERIWRLGPKASARDAQLGLRFTGDLDTTALRRALDEVVARHEILRTTLEVRGGELAQFIAEPDAVPLPERDATRETMPDIARQQLARGFDPADPPLRAVLVRTGEREHVLLVTLARLVADPGSLRILHAELTTGYAQGGTGDDSPPLSIQYADFAGWQREQVTETERERQSGFRRKDPADHASHPFGKEPLAGAPRPAASRRDLPAELVERLVNLGRTNGAPLSTVLLAAFGRELSGFSGQAELVIETPLDGRIRTETENLIGNFDVPVPLRLTASGEQGFRDWLDEVSERILAAHTDWTLPVKPAEDGPSIGFRFADLDREPVTLPGTSVEPLPIAFGPSGVALTLTVIREGDGFCGVWDYDERVLSATEIARLQDGFDLQLTAAGRPAKNEPETPSVAAIVSAAWSDILQQAEVDATDDFFELGGHSLAATRLARRLQSELDVRLPVRTIFDNPMLGDFTATVAQRVTEGA